MKTYNSTDSHTHYDLCPIDWEYSPVIAQS